MAGKGINVTDIELISNAPERRTNTFRIAIKAAEYDKAMNPAVWPYRVGVRRFIPRRPKGDWAFQSAQSGGNIHPERRDGYGRKHGGGARAHYGGQGGHHHRRDTAPSAPSAEQFHLDTQNRFNGLQDNVDN